MNTLMQSSAVVARPHPPVGRPSDSSRIAGAGWRLVATPFAPAAMHAANNAAKSFTAAKSTESARYAHNAKPAAPPRVEPR